MSNIYLFNRMVSVLLLSTTMAFSGPSVDDYAALLQAHPITPQCSSITVESNDGWLQSMRNGVGNTLRWVGDHVRKKEDKKTDVSLLRDFAKNAASSYVEHKTGIPITESMMNMAGNTLRWIGSKVRTYCDTPTLERAIMQIGDISTLSQSSKVIDELRKVSTAFAQTGTSSSYFVNLVHSIQDRGHHIKEQAYDLFAVATAKEILKDKDLQGDETAAKRTLMERLSTFLESISLATTFASIQNYVSDLYHKVMAWIR